MKLRAFAERGDIVTFHYRAHRLREPVTIHDAVVLTTFGEWFRFLAKDGSTGVGHSNDVLCWRSPLDEDAMVGGAS